MMDALQSTFGPWVGLAGFAVLMITFLPKVVVWYRGFRSRRRGSDCHIDERRLIDRELTYPDAAPDLVAHAKFGASCAALMPRRKYILLCSLGWLVPLALNLLMPTSWALRLPLFLMTVPIAAIGVWRLRHVLDKTVFYKTGFVHRIGFSKREIDYNAVIGFRKRQSSLTMTTSSYVFLIEDESPVAFMCADYFDGSRKVARVIKGLAPRMLRSVAEELAMKQKAGLEAQAGDRPVEGQAPGSQNVAVSNVDGKAQTG